MADGRPGFLRQLAAICALPTTVALVVPALLAWRNGIEIGWGLPGPLTALPPLLGGLAIVAGLRLVYETVALFRTVGEGTLAPWDPTRRLVARGPYRRVRNPMITGVGLVLLGEGVLLGSPPILIWLGLFATANAIYIPLVEEPGLERRFGGDYTRYAQAVPRWLPRLGRPRK